MDPITRPMFMGAAGATLPKIGDFYEGGYFAGYISHTANGNATHGLIVAPKASGSSESQLQWKTTNTTTFGTSSEYDGAANTANMANSEHPAANYCAGLTINGYSDWYLPALYELEIAYYNLKPTTDSNEIDEPGYGTNSYAVPQRSSNYTAGDPAQTSVAAFQAGNFGEEDGREYFGANGYWSSTESSISNDPATRTYAWMLDFQNGEQILKFKTTGQRVRAFRKFAV